MIKSGGKEENETELSEYNLESCSDKACWRAEVPHTCLKWTYQKSSALSETVYHPIKKRGIMNPYVSFLREGNGTPLQYSCLENPMDRGAWWAAVHGVTKSQTWPSGSTFTFHFHALEKEMATHSSVLAWRIPGMGEPGGLPSMGSHRVGHDWSDLAAAAAIACMCHVFIHSSLDGHLGYFSVSTVCFNKIIWFI